MQSDIIFRLQFVAVFGLKQVNVEKPGSHKNVVGKGKWAAAACWQRSERFGSID